MNEKETKAISLAVTEDLTVRVIPSEQHEFIMTTYTVAKGYETNEKAIRYAASKHQLEPIENQHYVKGSQILGTLGKNMQPHQIYWTKAGVIRLGFFIKSERARLFRDWAEKLILKVDEQKDLFGNSVIAMRQPKALHNRLTHDRIIDLMTDVCEIEDKDLRLRIVSKLTKGGAL